jgi:regulation of enolase protein 1 (concanavalin A-like superfamily)
MFNFDPKTAQWLSPPAKFSTGSGRVVITTDPKTDFWQRTYYGFSNDNAHVLYTMTKEPYFSFTVKAAFQYRTLFDQCGVAVYLDSGHWAKACVEFHGDGVNWLGSVVTNGGYSDWATSDISADTTVLWYRLSRRESDFQFEYSQDGVYFSQMRIFHLNGGGGEIKFGLLACSPGASSFDVEFTGMKVSDCVWHAHCP